MRIAFAGTPTFAAVALEALAEAQFDIALVLTQPDRPAGRGLRPTPGPVKLQALRLGLNLAQPATLRTAETVALLRSAGAQALVVAAYGVILPASVLEIFPAGCINIHASLLPRWRGAAPIQRAILAGDRETGISIMRMEQGLDTGPVYLTRKVPILADDTAGTLHDKLAALGASSIVDALGQIARGELDPSPQPVDGITYAHKITKAEAAIDWQRDAADVDRQVRAFNPFPGAFTQLEGETVKIWSGHVAQCAPAVPGEILACTEEGIDVACGSGMLRITQLQRAGSRRLSAAEFLRGAAPALGRRFGS